VPIPARSKPRPPGAGAFSRATTVLLAGAVLALICSCSTGPAAAAPVAPGAAEVAARAGAAADALLARFWDEGASDFRHAFPSTGEPAGYWISADALDAVVAAAARTGSPRYLAVARAFVDAQDRRGWARDWFDDEAWMALALLRLHALSGDPADLARATALLEDVAASAPDGTCCGTDPGGLWWDRAHSQKATASNAVPALVAARLFERTGDPRWLDFATSTYATWRDRMVGADGWVADHVLPSGERVWWRFSYDQGAMIGAAVALHHATGEAGYLEDARRFAAALLASTTRPTPFGPVLFDGASCSGDCDAFKGIAHRHLAELLAADPSVPGVAAVLAADGQASWALARDPATGTFGVDWGSSAGASRSLAAQASAALALEAEAARAGAGAPHPAALAAR
jgi:predicted alpha-1,6-mannanase (GH76 family)